MGVLHDAHFQHHALLPGAPSRASAPPPASSTTSASQHFLSGSQRHTSGSTATYLRNALGSDVSDAARESSTPATPRSPAMAPVGAGAGHNIESSISSLDLEDSKRPHTSSSGASSGHSQSRPRSYEKMQDSLLSESSAASGVIDKIVLLPDELVCVGLNTRAEKAWKEQVLHALFYPEDILPRSSAQQQQSGKPADNRRGQRDDGRNFDDESASDGEADEEGEEAEEEGDAVPMTGSPQRGLYSITPTPSRPIHSLQQSMQRTFSGASHASDAAPILLTSTAESEYPVSRSSILPAASPARAESTAPRRLRSSP